MARYPTLQDYEKQGDYETGIKRCDALLQKSPDDVRLLTTRFQLLSAAGQDNQSTLEKLTTNPRLDIQDIIDIEETILGLQKDVFPLPTTAGPAMTKLWDTAFKAASTAAGKHDVAGLRYARALKDGRTTDAHQALIQLKSFLPKNRSIYMAHAALTQLLSTSNEDIHARLARMLAKKAVTEKFDQDGSLDCRVVGQIYAIQGCLEDLEAIKETAFAKSKQAFDALRRPSDAAKNGGAEGHPNNDPAKTSTAEWLDLEVEQLKRQFAQSVDQQAQLSILESFAANATRLFKTASGTLTKARQRAVTDSCFLAVSALVRMYARRPHDPHLLHAAYLSEALLRYNPNIHEAKLILIYLYTRLELGPLAMRHYDALNVREIQVDTMAHVLFTRLAVTHPHTMAFGKRDTFDPLKRTTSALNVYNRYEDRLVETQVDVLSHGQTGMIVDLEELRHNLRASFSRRHTLLEHRRIARLTDQKVAEVANAMALGPRKVANWLSFTDNRDFDEAFNYGYPVERVLHGPIPGASYLLYGLSTDLIWSLSNDQGPLILDMPDLLDALKTLICSPDPGLLQAELLVTTINYHALSLHQDLHTSNPTSPHNHLFSLQALLQDLPVSALISSPSLLARTLRDHFIYLDTIRVLTQFIQKFTSSATPSAETNAQLRSLLPILQSHRNTLQTSAKQKKTAQTSSQIQTALMTSPFPPTDPSTEEQPPPISELCRTTEDKIHLKAFAEQVTDAARTSWEGIARVQFPPM